MCTTPYRPIKEDPPKTAEELLKMVLQKKGSGISIASCEMAVNVEKLIEKRKKYNITSDGI